MPERGDKKRRRNDREDADSEIEYLEQKKLELQKEVEVLEIRRDRLERSIRSNSKLQRKASSVAVRARLEKMAFSLAQELHEDRGQTLARTVRGMMYYKKALILQSLLEGNPDVEEGGFLDATLEESPGYRMARAIAETKFTYVVTCQIYGQQKQKGEQQAKDILYLMKK
ncbi:hypothetical protein R1sor_015945 [Riccia sorocarpa]|uniref:Glycosyl transferase 48 domain-containing protein n=1 Tax=Riccia sorocarpa TaxID=122646 RepID=A0ABD3HHU0_9MARC